MKRARHARICSLTQGARGCIYAANEDRYIDKFVLKDDSGTVQCVVWSDAQVSLDMLQVRTLDRSTRAAGRRAIKPAL